MVAATATPYERVPMHKYKRVRAAKSDSVDETKPLNEIRISAKGRTSTYISYASTLFAATNPGAEEEKERDQPKLDPKTNKPFQSIVLKGTGAALSTVVTVVEIVKRRFKGVEQQTEMGSFEIEDSYVPIEKNSKLEPLKQKRMVSFITVTLARQPGLLNKKSTGWQSPVPDDEIKELTAEEMLKPSAKKAYSKSGDEDDSDDEDGEEGDGESKPRRKGKGKGKGASKGKGKGKGYGKGSKGKGKGKKGKGKGKKGKGKGKRSSKEEEE